MGDVIAFPGTYRYYEAPVDEAGEPCLTDLAEDFLALRLQQQAAEQNPAFFEESPAQLRMNRLAAKILETRIDRAAQRLQQLPASTLEARSNIQTLFAMADATSSQIHILEEAALYATSAYWDAGFVTTSEIAPLLRGRAAAAQVRYDFANGVPATVDMIHAVVTQHVVGCTTGERFRRLSQIEHNGLLEYFDHPDDDPDGVPPAA